MLKYSSPENWDGATQSIYNQRYETTDLEEGKVHEVPLFEKSIVPLKFVANKKNIWITDKPSSSHFCRSVHLQYKNQQKSHKKKTLE